jgi:hypothetical protein
VFDKVTITYRGAKYEIGRGPGFYGVWTVGAPRTQPLQWWPETSEGWSAAWTRFAGIEAPGTIVPIGRRTPPIAHSSAEAEQSAAPVGTNSIPPAGSTVPPGSTVPIGGTTAPIGQVPGSGGQGTALLDERTAPVGLSGAPFAHGTAPFGQGGAAFGQGGAPFGTRTRRPGNVRTGAILATLLLAVGVILGVAGLFPAYLAGASLAQQPAEVVPHAIYFAVWTVSAVLILLGGARLRLGALLGLGISIVTFGLFFADAATVIAGGAHLGGWGLWLALVGWLACAAGSVVAFLLQPTGTPGAQDRKEVQDRPGRLSRLGFLRRPRGLELGPVVMLVLAGLGVAAAFAPAWDSYTLRTAAGQVQSFTAGNAFSNPGPVIAGDIAVMVALAAVVIVAALWRPIRHGAVLLAGAAVPMAAQAISAVIQAGEPASPTQFGLTPAQATQIGLTVDSGVTPAFWIYCGFLVALVVSCAWMLFAPHEAPGSAPSEAPGSVEGLWANADAYAWNPATPDAAEAASVEWPMAASHPAGPDGDEPAGGTRPASGTTPSAGPSAGTESSDTAR